MTAARRLAAILAADVVGYSRLMGEDEAGTARAVSEHREVARPIVASFSGRIVKTTGDGVLLEFPSIVAAVECAIAIQKLMVERNAETPGDKRIVYRIGVNLGDVLIEGDDILGDGVNIAARLEGICEPGGVLLSSSAYDHVRGKIDAGFYRSRRNGPEKHSAASAGLCGQDRCRRHSARASRLRAEQTRATARRRWLSCRSPISAAAREQDQFVDGVTESLTTDLSRIRHAVVIARNTAFTCKGRPLDAKTIGRELNVRYVLEGSVQRGASRMRVNIQLIDAETGNHLWAEQRFDKPIAGSLRYAGMKSWRVWPGALNAQLAAAEAAAVGISCSEPRPFDGPLLFKEWRGSIRVRSPTMRRASARAFRSRAHRRSRQCRGARWIGGCGHAGRRVFLCDRSPGSLRGSRSEVDQGPFLGPGPRRRAFAIGNCLHMDQARGAGHRRM